MSETPRDPPVPELPLTPAAEADPALSVEAEIGDLLGSARRAKGLSIAEVAHALRLGERQVEAIEVGAFELLPGKTFVRGFIRNYGRAMGIDYQPLLARLDEAGTLATPGLDLPESTHALMPATGASATRRWPLFVAIFLVLAAAVVWLVLPNEFWARKPAHPPSASQAAPGDTAAPVVIHPAPDAPAPSAADSAPAATGAGEAVVAPVAQIAADATNAQAADGEKTDAADATPQRKPGEKLLHFSFADNSWVEVRDRAGQLLLSKEFPAGSVRDLYGLPPLTVSIGNASEVTLAFEGKPVKLSPSQPSGVARVRLE